MSNYRENPDFYSSTLLNAIRADASDLYQSRIPIATKDNLAEVGNAILNWTPGRNEFASALVDIIGSTIIKSKMFKNPLAEFKRASNSYGKSIQEIFVDLITEYDYNPDRDAQQLYKRHLPDIKSVFHDVNRKGYFPITISNAMLSMAFQSESGVITVVDKIVEQLYNSDEMHEFLYMKNILFEAGRKGRIAVVTVPAVTDAESAKEAIIKIKEVSNAIQFPNQNYNYAGVLLNPTPKEKQVVMLSIGFDARMDVDVLASAFNMDKAEFIGRRKLLDDFGGLEDFGAFAILCDEEFLMVQDTQFRTEMEWNGKTLESYHFLHHWQILSSSPFENAIIFRSGAASTVTTVTVKPTSQTVMQGNVLQMVAEVAGTNLPSGKVTWEIAGNTSDLSYISSLGILVIAKDELGTLVAETGQVVTVTATSVQDPTKSGSATILIEPIPSYEPA